MSTITSADGTTITYDQIGTGPALVLVDGALQYRALNFATAPLIELLSPQFTVYQYDRRGRGDSTDTPPYAVEREIEDLAAIIQAAGGSACVFGVSSGAALALHAAEELGPGRITHLALYQAPYSTGDDEVKTAHADYVLEVDRMLAEGRRGDAVARFLGDLMSEEMLTEYKESEDWPRLEAVAHTLAYDNMVMGDGSMPLAVANAIRVPTVVITAAESPAFLRQSAHNLAATIPNAQFKTLAKSVPITLASILIAFFAPEITA